MRLCVLCPTRGRKPDHYEQPHACPSCRTWLARLPGDIVNLWARLGETDQIADTRTYEVKEAFIGPLRDGQQRPMLHTGIWRDDDPIAAALPTGANGARIGGEIVTGTREAPVPVNLDLIDLTLPAHGDNLTAHGKFWWEDQIGHLSVAMELDLIVRAWAGELEHRLPAPTVPVLAGWLTDRVGWACDHYPGVDVDAQTLSDLRGKLRAMLGETEQRPERMGAPCPGCDRVTLIRRPGEDKVECGHEDCRRVLTADEYDRWSRLTLADRAERMAA